MTNTQRLDTLPIDVLLPIFDYCTPSELSKLSRTCKSFYKNISDDHVWTKKSRKMVCTNQMSKRFRERCNPLLTSRAKCIISQCWQNKIKYEKNIYESVCSPNYRSSCLQMSKDIVMWGIMDEIRSYKRTGHCITESDVINNATVRCNSNRPSYFKQIVLCNDIIISSHLDGTVKRWVKKQKEEEDGEKKNNFEIATIYLDHPSSFVLAVDATSQNIVSSHSGWQFGGIRIRNINTSDGSVYSRKTIKNINGIASSLAIDPTGIRLAAGYRESNNVQIYDIDNAKLNETYQLETYRFTKNRSEGTTIIWEDPHTLLSYNINNIYKWDLRTGKRICLWSKPHINYEFRSISSDYQYTVMTGGTHGAVFVWDQRQKNFVSMYDLHFDAVVKSARLIKWNLAHESVTPIHSLQFDSSHLYAVSDERLYEYSFSKDVKSSGSSDMNESEL